MAEDNAELTAKIEELEERITALERLLLGDRLGALDGRRLPPIH
jgi:hypothetical protein